MRQILLGSQQITKVRGLVITKKRSGADDDQGIKSEILAHESYCLYLHITVQLFVCEY